MSGLVLWYNRLWPAEGLRHLMRVIISLVKFKQWFIGVAGRLWWSIKAWRPGRANFKSLGHEPFYPLLLGLYPLLFFYQTNIREVSPRDVIVPLAIVLAGMSLTFGLLRLIWRDWARAALFEATLLFVFFSHGQFLDALGTQLHLFGRAWQTERVLLVVWLGLLATMVIAERRFSRLAERLQRPLTLLAVGLVAVVGVQIGWHYIATPAAEAVSVDQADGQDDSTPLPTKRVSVGQTMPDVYYLMFEDHAAPSIMKSDYGYNEQPFLDQLTTMGFYVATDSHTNYPKTSFSISSSLNMDYLDALLPAVAPTASEASTVDKLFGHNKVGSFLQNQGYTYYNFGSWFVPTQKIREADVNVLPDAHDFLQYDSFPAKFFDTTLYPTLFKLVNPNVPSLHWIDQHREWAQYQYGEISDVISKPGPKFVFAHILQPHNPFVFDQNCQPISIDLSKQAAIPYYVGQTACTDQHALAIIQEILASSPTPPIIVLQSDEGPDAMANPLADDYGFKQASVASIKERTGILNAYYFPDRQYGQLSQSITPVNSFRVIFDQYFGASYPLLPDKTYVFADGKHLFDMTDITEELGLK